LFVVAGAGQLVAARRLPLAACRCQAAKQAGRPGALISRLMMSLIRAREPPRSPGPQLAARPSARSRTPARGAKFGRMRPLAATPTFVALAPGPPAGRKGSAGLARRQLETSGGAKVMQAGAASAPTSGPDGGAGRPAGR